MCFISQRHIENLCNKVFVMTAAICGLQRRNAYNFREHGPAWYRCWWLPMVYRGCRGALCPPLKFNYQAHWVFNSSLILFGWRLGRCSNCHPGESLERAGQERLWWRSVNCRCGGQDGRVMTRWAGLGCSIQLWQMAQLRADSFE